MKYLRDCSVIYLLFAVFLFSCEDESNKEITFEKVDVLFSDTSLTNICISKIHSNKKFNKFIFIDHDKPYTISKRLFKTEVYGNEFKDISKEKVLEDFKFYSKILESKGLVSCCLGVDSILMFRISSFNTEDLKIIDTNCVYDRYQYICITKKDIRFSFVHHEHYSDLFFYEPFYFYYSHKKR